MERLPSLTCYSKDHHLHIQLLMALSLLHLSFHHPRGRYLQHQQMNHYIIIVVNLKSIVATTVYYLNYPYNVISIGFQVANEVCFQEHSMATTMHYCSY